MKCPNWLSLAFINLSTQLWLIQTWFELTNPHFCSKYSLSIWNSTVLDLVGNVSLVLSWCFILPYSSALLSNLTAINPSHLISLSNLTVLPSLSPKCFPLSSPRLSHISTISVLGPKGVFPFELASFPPPCQPLFLTGSSSQSLQPARGSRAAHGSEGWLQERQVLVTTAAPSTVSSCFSSLGAATCQFEIPPLFS